MADQAIAEIPLEEKAAAAGEAAEEVKEQEAGFARAPLHQWAQEIEPEHIEDEVEWAGVEELEGEELPDLDVDNSVAGECAEAGQRVAAGDHTLVIGRVLTARKPLTPDLGGDATTSQMTQAIIEALE